MTSAERIGIFAPKIHPEAETEPKRRKSRGSSTDELGFAGVGVNLPIFETGRQHASLAKELE